MKSLPSLTIPQMLYRGKTAKTKYCTQINTTDQTNKNQINLILIEILSTKISLSLQPGNPRESLVTMTRSRQIIWVNRITLASLAPSSGFFNWLPLTSHRQFVKNFWKNFNQFLSDLHDDFKIKGVFIVCKIDRRKISLIDL